MNNKSFDEIFEIIKKASNTISEDDNSFHAIIEYIMENGISTDETDKRKNGGVVDGLPITREFDTGGHNKPMMKKSASCNCFSYLIYLTGRQLKEIFKTKVNKEHIWGDSRQTWAYILNGNDDIRYYLFIK